MDKSTSSNSSGTSSNLGHCACCHGLEQVREHWDNTEVLLCGPCLALTFIFEANGDLTRQVYAFWNRLEAGGL